MKNVALLRFLTILLVAFLVRLYHFNAPLAEWHSWRQVDTSSVSRNYVENGIDVLHPIYHDLSRIPSGKDNPNGYRFVEFPLFNVFQATFFQKVGIFTLEEWGRLISIASSLCATTFLYLFARRHYGERIALCTAFFFAFLPFTIFFHRTVLPDTAMVAATLGTIYFFDMWLDRKRVVAYVLAVIFGATALLLKPYALFFLFPIVYLSYLHHGIFFITKKTLLLFLALVCTPLLWWRWWMLQYPEGIPGTAWLFNEGGIRLSGAFFYWIFGERIGKLILGYWGSAFFIVGLLTSFPRKTYGVGLSFLLGALAYLVIIARGNVQHDYYQILITPTLALFLGIGMNTLLQQKGMFMKTVASLVSVGLVMLMFSLSWYHVRDFYMVNNDIVSVGKEVDVLLPRDAKVVTWMNGDTTFLYHIQRKGWAAFQEPLPQLQQKGADFLVLLHPTEKDLTLKNVYPLFAKGEKYAIFSLKKN